MAIDAAALNLWNSLKPHLPKRPRVLELGQANWFGDVEPRDVAELQGYTWDGLDLFALARLYYFALLQFTTLESIDRQGPGALDYDLNRPLPTALDQPYDIVINTGTAEHVFDQGQLFRTVHDHTAVGGLMVHAFPVAGCAEHGFYTYQPNLLRELAAANGYRLLAAVTSRTGGDEVLHLAWQKVEGLPFVVPQQGACRGINGGGFTPFPAPDDGATTLLLPGDAMDTPETKLAALQAENAEMRGNMVKMLRILDDVRHARTLPVQLRVDLTPGQESVTVLPLTPVLVAALQEHQAALDSCLASVNEETD